MSLLDKFRTNKTSSMTDDDDDDDGLLDSEASDRVPVGSEVENSDGSGIETEAETETEEDNVEDFKTKLQELQRVHDTFISEVVRLMPGEVLEMVRSGKSLPESVTAFLKSRT